MATNVCISRLFQHGLGHFKVIIGLFKGGAAPATWRWAAKNGGYVIFFGQQW